MVLTKTQQEVVDRYMDITESYPEERLSMEKLLSFAHLFANRRPDWAVLEQCEQEWLTDYRVEEY
jgi:hypothetical protein